jgi:hypothetical protein
MSGGNLQSVTVPPEKLRRLLLYLDGMRYASAICQASYERALAVLRSFEFGQKSAPVLTKQAALAIADTWSIVDSTHRVRLLAQRMPYSRLLRPEFEPFERSTRAVEELRHYVQHLDEKISSLPENSTPVWGRLRGKVRKIIEWHLRWLRGRFRLVKATIHSYGTELRADSSDRLT